MRFAHTRHGCCLHGRRPTAHRNFLRNLSLAINLEISEKSLIWGNDFMRDYAFRIVSSMGILFCQSKGLVHYNRTRIHVIYHATAHGCSWLRWNMDHNRGVIPQGILCRLCADTWIFEKISSFIDGTKTFVLTEISIGNKYHCNFNTHLNIGRLFSILVTFGISFI